MVLNPINPSELRSRLNNGVVQFAFKKVDGNLRTAIGTTNLSSIPVKHHPNGGNPRRDAVAYYDVEKQEWRSVSLNSEVFITE